MQECPLGTFKNATGSDRSLCYKCPTYELPHRAVYITVRGVYFLNSYSLNIMSLVCECHCWCVSYFNCGCLPH